MTAAAQLELGAVPPVAPTVVVIDVAGTPAGKGSPQIITRGRGGAPLPFPRVAPDSKATAEWARQVKRAARLAVRDGLVTAAFVDTPLWVEVVFRLARPKGHYGARGLLPSAPRWPAVKPDIDKLVRNTLDPLHTLVLDDDSRIVELHARKVYAQLGEEPGARIVIRAATAAEGTF